MYTYMPHVGQGSVFLINMLNLFTRSTGRHYSNKFEYCSVNASRRQSVTPSGKKIRRHTYEGAGGGQSPLGSPQQPPSPSAANSGSLKPPTSECQDLFSTKLDQLTSLLGLRRKESIQSEYFEVWDRHVTLLNEFREIMSVVEHLERVYGVSKTSGPLTRFRQLRSCVQRTHMFLQVCAVHSSLAKDLSAYYAKNTEETSDSNFQKSLQRGSVIGSQAKELEALRQKEEAFERTFLPFHI